MRYICMSCGHIYDETIGDPDSGIAPDTKWAEIPEHWECPFCGAAKMHFERYED